MLLGESKRGVSPSFYFFPLPCQGRGIIRGWVVEYGDKGGWGRDIFYFSLYLFPPATL